MELMVMVYKIYYKKRNIFLFSLLSLGFAIIFLYMMSEEMCFFTQSEYSPSFLRTLHKVSLTSIAGFLFFFSLFCFFMPKLYIRGPRYIITHEGIIDYKYGLLSWSEISSMQRIKFSINGQKQDLISIKIKNPHAYFGIYKSLFGLRRYLSIDVSTMTGNIEFENYISSKKLNSL